MTESVDWFARVIALIGIILTLVKIGYDAWKERRKLKVKFEFDAHPRMTEFCLKIRVVNVGRRPIRITGMWLEIDEDGTYGITEYFSFIPEGRVRISEGIIEGSQFPKRIDDGESVLIFIPTSYIRHHLEAGEPVNQIVITDTEGKQHNKKIPKKVKKRILR